VKLNLYKRSLMVMGFLGFLGFLGKIKREKNDKHSFPFLPTRTFMFINFSIHRKMIENLSIPL